MLCVYVIDFYSTFNITLNLRREVHLDLCYFSIRNGLFNIFISEVKNVILVLETVYLIYIHLISLLCEG